MNDTVKATQTKLIAQLSRLRMRLGESRTGRGWARIHDAIERCEAKIDVIRMKGGK